MLHALARDVALRSCIFLKTGRQKQALQLPPMFDNTGRTATGLIGGREQGYAQYINQPLGRSNVFA